MLASSKGWNATRQKRSVFSQLPESNTFTLVSEMELCLLKGASGMGLLEDGCDLLEVADSVGRDLGDALLA